MIKRVFAEWLVGVAVAEQPPLAGRKIESDGIGGAIEEDKQCCRRWSVGVSVARLHRAEKHA